MNQPTDHAPPPYEARIHKALRDYGEGDEDPGTGSDYGDQTAVVMRVRDAELERLRAERDQLTAKLAEYDNAITWHTTCLACSRVLDSCYRETVRAEQAEATLGRAREFVADMRTWCSPHGIAADYADRLEAVLDGPAAEQSAGEAL